MVDDQTASDRYLRNPAPDGLFRIVYYESRPTLAIPRPRVGAADAALALNGDWGLHPALKDSLYPLWEKKQIAFVPFAGADDLTRSHFETQDTIELGQPVHATRNYNSGFMARLVAVLTKARPIAYAFDLLELDGEDLRLVPLSARNAKLAKLLARKPTGIVFNEHTEEDGVVVFRHACKLGLEGIVSKRLPASR
jgi:hypothetical protein